MKIGIFLKDRIKSSFRKILMQRKKLKKHSSSATQATLTATRLVDDYDNRREIQEEVNKIKDPDLKKKTMSEASGALQSEKTS